MPNPNRRTVLRGAGLVLGASVAGVGAVGPAHAEPDPGEQDLAHLRRTFVLAEQARETGGAPYGALVADAAGSVVAAHGNTSSVDGGDPTDHAEMVTVRTAWRALGDDGMRSATLYASTEPCTMCAGGAYWSGIGRLVYGMSDTRLLQFTGDDPKSAGYALPCRDILLHGYRPITVIGPLLEDEAAQAHQGYWR
ncbi:nucleoside deaminase [Mycolicibacterium sp. 141076]|uniref:nucleoside deaminase n=1 Tax=Mycobacteriaceae TaxID=1762 RepID=UPI00299EE079|nr:nucleoside deaminase [Mycolicibacterium sp. 141076]MDX1878114.1 nucleoside deaminase [Mycolicibacterium sp. 141076]